MEYNVYTWEVVSLTSILSQEMFLSNKHIKAKDARFFIKLVLPPLFHLSATLPILVSLPLPLNSHSTNEKQKGAASAYTF